MRISDVESYSLVAIGANATLKEFLGARADNNLAKMDMYKDISLYGTTFQKDQRNDLTENQALNTAAVYMIAAGLANDLLQQELTEEDVKNNIKQKAGKQ